jgi:menaquinone-dependent protoporphyrinogen oxidase
MTGVLVAYASRMGATREIAEVIGTRLAAAGLDVTVRDCADRPDADGYQALVVGSAIYVRRWLPAAKALLRTLGPEWRGRVWLFHSGPCGDGAETEQVAAPRSVRKIATALGTAPVMTFGGRLDRSQAVGPISRWMATGTELAGDFRDFDRIRAWADDIAYALTGRAEVKA